MAALENQPPLAEQPLFLHANFLHATALIIGEHGLLIRGASGAGKSTLALDLLRASALAGKFARLVGDDRIGLKVQSGRLIASPHPEIAGWIELRNIGLVARPYERRCVVHSLVDLGEGAERFPSNGNLVVELLGVKIYHLFLNSSEISSSRCVLAVEALIERAASETKVI